MNRFQRCSLLALCVIALGGTGAAPSDDQPWKTRAERSDFTETSQLEDVQSFLRTLSAGSPLARVSTFGTSEEGRPLVLVTLSNPPVSEPREVRALNRPVVLLQANIHGGEVEGKEAVQNIMRRLAMLDLRPVLDRVVVLVAPIYNVDGNEKIDVMNRTAQYGPIAGVGERENAKGLDLNRDFMKLESAEARALVKLFNVWDPDVVVDLHTTNGSYHGYHLTYSIPVNLSFDPKLLNFERDVLMPALQGAMLDRHAFRTYYYGNFEGRAPGRGDEGDPGTRKWVAFDHRPRIGQNYVGLRNRIAILSEAYSYLDFRRRIAVTESFVEEILRYVEAHPAEIMALTAGLDGDWVRTSTRDDEQALLGVAYAAKALPSKVPILVGSVTHEVNPGNGKEMLVASNDFTPVEMEDYGYFAPTRNVVIARSYVLPRTDAMKPIVEKLRQHGIRVEELTAPVQAPVATFTVESATKVKREFQGHHERHVTGGYATNSEMLPVGTIIVPTAQPLGRLAAYLLEPESDDGLVNWNYFDAQLEPGKPAPVRKVMDKVPMSTRAIESF